MELAVGGGVRAGVPHGSRLGSPRKRGPRCLARSGWLPGWASSWLAHSLGAGQPLQMAVFGRETHRGTPGLVLGTSLVGAVSEPRSLAGQSRISLSLGLCLPRGDFLPCPVRAGDEQVRGSATRL